MKRLRFLFFVAALIQGLTAFGQHKFNPEAIKLNDSAVALIMNPPWHTSKKIDPATQAALDQPAKVTKVPLKIPRVEVMPPLPNNDSLYERAISIVNKAIQIDSNYFIAYFNKFNFQTSIKQYQAAFVTGKQMLMMRPNDGTIHYLVGMACERTGDTLSAKKYYEEALVQHEKVLASIDTNDKHFNSIKAAKASDLFMLGRTKEAHDIWSELYNKADERYKWQYENLWKWTRADFLKGSHSEDSGIIYPDKK